MADSGADVVIAHGPFCSASETSALLRQVPAGIAVRRVMLLATYEVALERVTGDSSRGLSKDPKSLRTTYERFLNCCVTSKCANGLSIRRRAVWAIS